MREDPDDLKLAAAVPFGRYRIQEFATLDRALFSSFSAMFGDWEPWP